MSKVHIRQYGDPVQTRDGRMLVRDTVLNGNFRITPDTRILPEPAPAVAPGDMGVRYDGKGGIPRQDADQLMNAFLEGISLLSAAEVARIKAQLLKFAGSSSTTTNNVGITANDSVRRGVDAVTTINDANKRFWDDKNTAEERRLFGR